MGGKVGLRAFPFHPEFPLRLFGAVARLRRLGFPGSRPRALLSQVIPFRA